jgi:hypothetical protein
MPVRTGGQYVADKKTGEVKPAPGWKPAKEAPAPKPDPARVAAPEDDPPSERSGETSPPAKPEGDPSKPAKPKGS